MGVIERVFGLVFGGGGTAIRDTVEMFRENAEAGAARGSDIRQQAMAQFGTEFSGPRQGWFDRFMDGVNRLPRPMLALGTLGLFLSAMLDPLWFSERMQGIALVPEPLWWLLGVIVSFYFGARQQLKTQQFHRAIVDSVARVPQVVANIDTIRSMRSGDVKVADTGEDARLTVDSVVPEANAALEAWRAAA